MLKPLYHIIKIIFGILLVLIGIIGGLVPIFQGWIFGLPGIIILANYFPPLKRVVDWGKMKINKPPFNKKNRNKS